MRRTIYLPDELADRADAYLRAHPGLSLSALVQAALEERLAPPELGGILELAGLVPEAATPAREQAEDAVVRRER